MINTLTYLYQYSDETPLVPTHHMKTTTMNPNPNPNTTIFTPLHPDQTPWLLFRVEHRLSMSTGNLSAQARLQRTIHLTPTPADFDHHLSYSKDHLTPFLSFFSSWKRALKWYRAFRTEGRNEVSITALWAKDLGNVYDAEAVARALGFRDGDGANPRRMLRNHVGEFLVHGGVVDAYRFLAVFRGVEVLSLPSPAPLLSPSVPPPVPPGPISGRDVEVVFECEVCTALVCLPEGFLPRDGVFGVEEEIVRRTGIRHELWRDMLVSAIVGRAVNWGERLMGPDQRVYLFGDPGMGPVAVVGGR